MKDIAAKRNHVRSYHNAPNKWDVKVCKEPVNIVDFYPTLLNILDITPDPVQHMDGISFLPLLKNPDAKLEHEAMYWHYPLENPHFLGGRSSGALRQGDWKLIESFEMGKIELYNLAQDIEEKNDLSDKFPEIKRKMLLMLQDWQKSIGLERFRKSNA